MKNWCFLLLAALFLSANAYPQKEKGSISLTITDKETKQPVPFVNVAVLDGKKLISGAASDFEGFVFINKILPGTYSIQLSSTGMDSKRIDSVVIEGGKTTYVPADQTNISEEELDGFYAENPLHVIPITNLSSYNCICDGYITVEIEETTSVDFRNDHLENFSIYVDGAKQTKRRTIPLCAVEEYTVFTRSVPAQFEN